MNTLARFAALLILTLQAIGATPPQSIDLDLSQTARAFKLQFAEGTTPLLRTNVKNAGAAYTVTGWTATLYLQATWDDTSVIAIPSTTTGATYFDFQMDATDTSTNGVFYANIIATDGTATVEWQRGQVDIRQSPGTAGAGTIDLTTPLSWSGYTYSGTAASGPSRAGTNVTFSANADGSVDINSADTLGALTPTAGRLVYGDGTNWVALAAGTSGHILTAAGAAAPTWSSAGAGDLTGVTGSGGIVVVTNGNGPIPDVNVSTNAVRSAVSGIYLPLDGTSGKSIAWSANTLAVTSNYFYVQQTTDDGKVTLMSEDAPSGTIEFTDSTGADATYLSQKAGGGGLLRDGLYTIWDSGNDGAASTLDADILDGQHGAYYRNGANITNGTAIVGLVDMPTGHTAGITNLVGIAGDGVTPVFVPTSSTWQGFIAYRATTAQSLTLGATTIGIFNAEVRDALSLYDTSTGYFRPNKTGLWRLTGSAAVAAGTGNPGTLGSYYDMRVLKVSDSSVVAQLAFGRVMSTATSPPSLTAGSHLAYLTSGVDYAFAINIGDTKAWQMFNSETASRIEAEFVAE